MTKLLNKGATEKYIAELLELEEQNKEAGALLIIDLDNFKSINDNLGHSIGDEVLKEIGLILVKNFKGSDILGRIGGDEFMVYMRDIHSSLNALEMGNKLCKETIKEFSEGQLKDKVSLSIGIAIYPTEGQKFIELYQAADKALYKAKRKGKGQAEINKEY